MTNRYIDVFFYGLFMDSLALRDKGVSVTDQRTVCVRGFTLLIGDRATLWPHPAGKVYGVLMKLRHIDIEVLYSGPSLAAYRPEAVLAQLLEGSAVPALC